MNPLMKTLLILSAGMLTFNTAANSNKVSINHIDVHDIKSTYFELGEQQTVDIEFVAPKKQNNDDLVWILDLDTRQTVWRSHNAEPLGSSKHSSKHDKVRVYGDQPTLDKGRYGVFYSTYNFHYDHSRGVDILLYGLSSLLTEKSNITRDDIDLFYVDVRAKALQTIKSDKIINPFANTNELFSLTKVRRESFKQYGFTVNQSTELSIYAIGEITRNKAADTAWLKNFDTGDVVWQMTRSNTDAAGGAGKNRLFRGKVPVAKGRYVLTYTNDDSHHYNDFNDSPPFDPNAWGISVFSKKDAAIERFDPEQKLNALKITAITGVGDHAYRSRHFSLSQATEVRIIALGEADDDDMLDFGWIEDSQNQRKVWTMKASHTTHAGGADKNRLSDTLITLPAGEYSVFYASDGSHSFDGGWNQSRPFDEEQWGIALYGIGEKFDKKSVKLLDKTSNAPLVQLTRVAEDEHKTAVFDLDADQKVRIYAIGEGEPEDMMDYAFIRNVKTGKRVWHMFFDETKHGGGANKNRLADEVIELKKGQYKVYFITDGSHSYGDWNDNPPFDQQNYGVTVSAVVKQKGNK